MSTCARAAARCRSRKPLDVFDYVYAEQTEELAEQKAGYAAYLDSFETAGGHR